MSTGAHKIADIVGVSGNEKSLLYKSIKSGGGGSSKVEPEEKDVNFYDYDGTRMYSFTKEEFLALNEMPATHDREEEELVADGWNWDFEEAKTHVETYRYLNVGAQYSSEHSAIFYITIDAFRNFSLAFANPRAVIDWGDGITESITTTSVTHSYTKPGEYKVVVDVNNTTIIFGTNQASSLAAVTKLIADPTVCPRQIYYWGSLEYLCYLTPKTGVTQTLTLPTYTSSLKFIVVPKNVKIDSFTQYLYSLKNVIYNCLKNNSNNSISDAGIAGTVICPNSTTTITCPKYSGVQKIIVSSGTTMQGQCIVKDYGLKLLVLPQTITNIANYSIQQLKCTKIVLHASVPPTITNSSFYEVTDIKFYVPDASVDAYKAATNWSQYADKIYPISQANI